MRRAWVVGPARGKGASGGRLRATVRAREATGLACLVCAAPAPLRLAVVHGAGATGADWRGEQTE